ncbi:MAG: WYL domain-containing protein, partial [Bacteroidales bacterium]|nr:WYL domain-containing protein [Bacteroidales bacterium]
IDVWAYDIEDGKNKLFKISRIDWVDIVDEDWDNEEKHEKGFLDIFRMQSFHQTHVRLEMTMLAKNLLCEEFPLASQEVVQEGDKWVLDTMVSAMEGVGRFVIGLAKEIKIVDSPELVDYIRSYRDFINNI